MFPKLRTPKNVVRKMLKNCPFRRPFDKQHGKRAQTLLKSEQQHLYHIFGSLWRKLSWKKSLLVICMFWQLFVNTLAADDKYSLLNTDNLTRPIQMQLSQKPKKVLQFFSAFLQTKSNFKHFQKRMSLMVYAFPNLRTQKKVVR